MLFRSKLMNNFGFKNQTKKMIDDIKAICSNYGLGNAGSEYKIITEVFLYKFLNDKFINESKKIIKDFSDLSNKDVEIKLANLTDDEYELMLMELSPSTAKLKKEHFISYLFNKMNQNNFYKVFDETLLSIANNNLDIFSVKTGGQSKLKLFESISQYVIERSEERRVGE